MNSKSLDFEYTNFAWKVLLLKCIEETHAFHPEARNLSSLRPSQAHHFICWAGGGSWEGGSYTDALRDVHVVTVGIPQQSCMAAINARCHLAACFAICS